jgi:GNAT superfamily N-acetyltransferase
MAAPLAGQLLQTPPDAGPIASPPPEPLIITVAEPSDTQPLLPLIASAYRGEASRAGWTTEADLLTGDRIDATDLLKKITQPHGAVLVARDGAGTLVACVEVVRQDDNMALLGLFAVNPSRQGGGLGRQMLERAEMYAKDTLGVGLMEMNVLWVRKELIAWYMRRGYEHVGTRDVPWEQLVKGSKALRDDLYFDVLAKSL